MHENKAKSEIIDKNIIKFDFFLQFYKSTMMWNKILYQEDKLGMLTERRDLLEAAKHDEYKKICTKMAAHDEKIMANIHGSYGILDQYLWMSAIL